MGLDCSIRLWDLKDATELKCIDGGPADAWSISFSPDGSKLATGANGGNVRVSCQGVEFRYLNLDTKFKWEFFSEFVFFALRKRWVVGGSESDARRLARSPLIGR